MQVHSLGVQKKIKNSYLLLKVRDGIPIVRDLIIERAVPDLRKVRHGVTYGDRSVGSRR